MACRAATSWAGRSSGTCTAYPMPRRLMWSGWRRRGGPIGCGPSCCCGWAGREPRAARSATGLERPAALPLALVLREEPLPEADRLGRDFDQLVLGDELEGILEGQRRWRREAERLVVGMGPDVGELLLLGRVDVHVAGSSVLADDHALVDLDPGTDEQLGPLLEVEQAVGVARPGPIGHQDAGRAMRHFAGPGP